MNKALLGMALCAMVSVACSDAPVEENTMVEPQEAGPRGPVDGALVADAGGEPDDAGSDDPDNGLETSEDGGVDPDTGVEGVDAELDPPDGAIEPGAPLVATILLTELPQEGAESASASVNIGPPQPLDGEPGCIVTRVDPGAPAPAVAASADNGTLTITGTVGGPLIFDRDANGVYQPSRGVGTDVFSDAASLRVSSTGGAQMGGFEIDLVAPQRVSIQSPSNLGNYDKDRDLNASWNAAGGVSVLITVLPISLGGDPESGDWIFCGAPDTGSFTIPSAQMRQLRGGPILPGLVLIAVTRANAAEASVGDHSAVFVATTSYGQPFWIR